MADGAEDRNTCLNMINEYNRDRHVKRFLQLVLKFFLFVLTLNPFAIYKPSTYSASDAPRYQIYQTSPLRIETNYLDEWLRRWRTVVRCAISYFCLKFTAITVLQVALHTSRLSSGEEKSSKLGDWEAAVSEQGLLMIWGQLLGNPFVLLPGLSIYTYGLVVAIIGYTFVHLFHRYTKQPLNSSELRLWLEPARELRRIDLRILQTLIHLSRPIERCCYCQAACCRRKYASIGPDFDLLKNREIQGQVINSFRSRYWHLRPVSYTFGWYKAMDKFVYLISIPTVLVEFTFSSCCLLYVFSFLISSGLLYEPSLYQVITFMELAVSFFFLAPLCFILIVMVTSLCYSHCLLLDDVKQELDTCLWKLRRINCHQLEPAEPLPAICITLKPLIKVYLSLEELKNNVRFLTEMVSVNVIISSSTCIFILLADYLDGDNLKGFRFVVIFAHWVWANLVALLCSYIYNCGSDLEATTWSMLAELRARESKGNWILYEFQVAEFWRRLVMSRCFSNSQMSVQPFGVTLTYDRTLELNFLAISFASLLRSF